MTGYRFSRLLAALSLAGLSACAAPAGAAASPWHDVSAVPVGADLGASARVPVGRSVDAAEVAARREAARPPVRLVADAQADVPATGVVNSIDASGKRVNLSHQPIPAIGWPAMTMDFPVAPSVDLGSVKPGNRVNVTLRKGKDGMYEIRSVRPAATAP